MRNSTWTLSNLCRGKPTPNYHLVAPALPILANLLYSVDEEVIVDTCWAVSFISDGSNERIQRVIEAGMVPRLVELLHSSPSIQAPALRAIGEFLIFINLYKWIKGNIATGTYTQTTVALNCGLISALRPLLSHKKKVIRKETCWTFSNITAGSRDHIQQVINANVFPQVIELLKNDDFDVKKEAAWAIANATSGGSDQQIDYLVQKGCIAPLCDLLRSKDARTVTVVLEALENILSIGERVSEDNDGVNKYADYIEEAGGLDNIEYLQSHEDTEVYKKAVKILETYFGVEEDTRSREEQTELSFGEQVPLPPGGFQFN